MSNIGIGTDENGKCEISFSADLPAAQPTPKVDKIALRNNDLMDLAHQLERDYAELKRKLRMERELWQNANGIVEACERRATIAEDTLTQLKEQVAIVRNNILDGYGCLESVLNSDQTNAVLKAFDLIYNAYPRNEWATLPIRGK